MFAMISDHAPSYHCPNNCVRVGGSKLLPAQVSQFVTDASCELLASVTSSETGEVLSCETKA